jgi:hypothetical protein
MAACESSALVDGYRKGRAEKRCVFVRSASLCVHMVDRHAFFLRHVASAEATARYYEFKKRRAEALEDETRGRLRRA